MTEAKQHDKDDEVRELLGGLPCPFCGGTKLHTYPGSTFRWRYAACDECGAQTGETRINTMTQPRPQAIDDAQADLLKDWNTRTVALPELQRPKDGPFAGLLESISALSREEDGGWSPDASRHLRMIQSFARMELADRVAASAIGEGSARAYYRGALDRAAYTLFTLKRYADMPQAAIDLCRTEHEAACRVLDGDGTASATPLSKEEKHD